MNPTSPFAARCRSVAARLLAALGVAAALPGQTARPEQGVIPGESWIQVVSGPGVPDMLDAGMAYDASRDRVVLYGGYACSLPSGQTWEWDGTRWQRIVPAANLPSRFAPAMAYDSHRKRTVVFGGALGVRELDDLWEWDGTSWTERMVTVRPPARFHHMMVYDEARRRVVMFGGVAGRVWFDDTWTWDGTSWEEQTPATRPRPRGYAGMAYDPDRDRVVMFGGLVDVGSVALLTDETWEWDGTDWHLQHPTVRPQARGKVGLVYDPQRRRTILFGGSDQSSGPGFADTWAWDGQQWTRLAVNGPPGGSSHGMVYDSRRGGILLSGGGYGTEWGVYCYDQTWALESPTPGFAAFGTGCPGSRGTPRLSLEGAVPGMPGGSLSLRLSNVPATPGTALLALGLSRNEWNSFSLPWTMTILGAPSCSLWAAPEVLLGAAVNGNVADLTLQIPPNQGFELHAQGVVLDAGVSRGFSVSHGATIIGQ